MEKLKNIKNVIKQPITQQLITLFFVVVSFFVLYASVYLFINPGSNPTHFSKFSSLWLTLSYIILFAGMLFFLPKRIGMVLYGSIYYLFFIVSISQMIHFNILHKTYTFSDLALAGEGSQYLSMIVQTLTPSFVVFVVVTLLLGVATLLLLKKNGMIKLKYRYLLIPLILFGFARFYGLMQVGPLVSEGEWDAWKGSRNIYNTFSNPTYASRISGIYEYTVRDVYLHLESIMLNKKDDMVAYVDEFYASHTIESAETTMTGMLQDKNVIMIMMESIDDWMVTEEHMPTLYRMSQEGMDFTNRYAPFFGNGATYNTEFSVMTGLHAPTRLNLVYNYSKNTFPVALPNLFKQSGYAVSSTHFNTATFYNRGINHIQFGFEKHNSLMDLKYNTVMNVENDSVLLDNDDVYRMIVPETGKFMSYFLTYSAHAPYDSGNQMCKEGLDLSLENYQEVCIRYLSSLTDQFIEKLVLRLEEDGKLEDTVLVLYGDHFAYGYVNEQNRYELKGVDESNLDQKVPFIIWGADVPNMEVDTMVKSVDIGPTVLNLFGIPFDSTHYIGTDVFSNYHENFIYFNDYSWYDGSLYYKGESLDYYSDDLHEYIIEIGNKVSTKFKLNDAILDGDYYKTLNNER